MGDTVRITKVMGHADAKMVRLGQVRESDRLGNDAADFGRRRVGPAVIDARRNLSGVCRRWYPIVVGLHRFFIAISRAVVNHDAHEGTALDPLVCLLVLFPRGVGCGCREEFHEVSISHSSLEEIEDSWLSRLGARTKNSTFGVARVTLQTRKLWLVGVATDRDARHACLRFFSFFCWHTKR